MSTFVSRDSKGKLRVAEISTAWCEEENAFAIYRTTYQYNGKRTEQPTVYVRVGKASRTLKEQLELEYRSHCKKWIDKGYKLLEHPIEDYSENELLEIVGDVKTDATGMLKPMLAKQADAVTNKKIFDKDWYISRKINGVRCLVFYKDGEIHTRSRGSIDYDFVLNHIITHPTLIAFFERHPDVILDSEIYQFGKTLNHISGICRSQQTVNDGKDLQLYWYDIVDLNMPFSERYKLIYQYAQEMGLPEFNPFRKNNGKDLAIQVVPHEAISGWDNMMKRHNEFVAEGWEGAVIRLSSSPYKPGSRSSDWVKIKVYTEGEYPIVGIAEGLRPEDMCFVLEAENGQRFNCKPIGDREQKDWYREHIDELIGKQLTIKYFEMSGVEGSMIPQQPIGLVIRDYE